MRRITFFFLTFFITAALFAQDLRKVMGTVVDSASNKPLPGVNVMAVSIKDSSIITGAATNEDGKFKLEGIPDRNVKIRASMVGYQAKSVLVKIEKSGVDIGRIILNASVYELSEAVVQAQRPMIEYDADKAIVNMDRTPESDGSVTDALRSSGAVNVDPVTNKISLRGGSNTKILIDGKPFLMTSIMLSQMPAGSIEKAEIISNPSAKEDPEGDSGIINLITKKGGLGTFSGLAGLGVDSRQRNDGILMLNLKRDKLSIFGNISGSIGENHGSNDNLFRNFNSGTKYLQEFKSKNDFDGSFYDVKSGIDYNIDTMNIISLTGGYSYSDYGWKKSSESNFYSSDYVYNDSSYSRINKGGDLRREYSAAAFYRKKFNMMGHELTIDGYYADMDYDNTDNFNAYYNYDPDFPEMQNNLTNTDNKFFIFKTDYVNPAAIGKFEAGYNFTFRDRTNDYNALNYDYAEQAWADYLNYSNEFNYKENIHALYSTFTGGLGKFQYKGGLRLEQAYTTGGQRVTGDSFDKDYLSLYPSVFVSYMLWKNFPISANAAKKVIRPQMDMINPFVKRTSPTSVYVGNPEIDPTYIYVYELNFERMLRLFYTSEDGSPANAEIANSDGSVTSTTVNMARIKRYGAESSISYINGDPRMPFTLPKWIGMITLNGQYFRYEGEGSYGAESLNSKSDNWIMNASANLSVWYDIKANMSVYYHPENNDNRHRTSSHLYLNMRLSKSFMDKNLKVFVKIQDLLNTRKEYIDEEFGNSYYAYNRTGNDRGRSISIAFVYSFNNYNPKEERDVRDGRDSGDNSMGDPGGN